MTPSGWGMPGSTAARPTPTSPRSPAASRTGIRDLYVHAGPLEHDGTLPESAYPKARWLIAAVHREPPGVRVQAWLGDVLATESPAGMRLERAGHPRRRRHAPPGRSSAAGFEGAHFDLEPLHSGDRDYLTLLDSLRRSPAPTRPALRRRPPDRPAPGLHSFVGARSPGTPSGGRRRSSGRSPAGSTRSP